MQIDTSTLLTWLISAAAISGIIMKPFRWPEAVWAVSGAVILVCAGLLPLSKALDGIAKGLDVYLFLTGMMLLAEAARHEGLFDWLAKLAARHAKGSAERLFTLIYAFGTLVTIFLSNDATAVVLTPAVATAVKEAKVRRPLPYLLICAFIANAASFVLPISNPANLVIYGSHMPALLAWLTQYALPSVLSIGITYVLLRQTQKNDLGQEIAMDDERQALSRGGKITAAGIILTAFVLLACSATNVQLGLPTAIAGAATMTAALLASRRKIFAMLKGISWDVLPLVAGLFVLVEGLERTGLIKTIATVLQSAARDHASQANWVSGTGVAVLSNVMNNLPVGLIAGDAAQQGHLTESLKAALLIGTDIGPNLSVTGSLATILWLTALRRDGHRVGRWDFLKVGMIVMPPALLLALGPTLLFNHL